MSASTATSSLPLGSGGKSIPGPTRVVRQKFVGRADIIAWCPVLNLLVVSMNKTSVWAYRLDGERVYSTNNKLEITAIAFRDDGHLFCVTGFDGSLKIYDSNDGSLIKTLKESFGSVSTLLWDQHIVSSKNPLEGLYDVNIVDHMPQLTDGNLMTPLGNHDESGLDFMIIASESDAFVSFKGILTVTSFAAPSGVLFVKQLRTSDVGNICFLCRDASLQYCIVRYSLSSECSHLIRVIRTLVQLEATCSLLGYQIDSLQGEVEPYFSFLDRTLDNLRDSIESQNQPRLEIVNRLSEILLTGLIPLKLKDFWLNQLGERGIRRLTKLGNTCYDALRERIFTHVVQALNKVIVLLSELRGLAIWLRDSKDSHDYGLCINTLDTMITSCQSLLEQLFAALRDINKEQQLFVSFVNWIKAEIVDKISKEDDIQSYLARPFPVGFTHANVMTFISRHLFNSRLYAYFDCATACDIITQMECPSSFDLAVELVLGLKTSIVNDFGKFYCSRLMPEVIQLPELGSIHESSIDLSYTPADHSIMVAGHTTDSLVIVRLGPYAEKSTTVIQFHGEQVVTIASKDDTALILLIKGKNSFRVDIMDVQFSTNNSTRIDYLSCLKRTLLDTEQIKLDDPKTLVLSHKNPSKCNVFLQDIDQRNYIVFEA